MQIYVGKNGQQLGPFSLEEINRKLADRTLVATDLAWYEGAAGWAPLSGVAGVVVSTAPVTPAAATAPPVTPAPAPAPAPTPAAIPVRSNASIVQPPPSASAAYKTFARVGWALIGITLLISFIPILGCGTWILVWPVAVAAIILGIVCLTRGGTGQGVALILAAIVLVPVALIAPILSTALLGNGGDRVQANHILENLRTIDAAKGQWAAQTKAVDGAPVTMANLTTYLSGKEITSWAGEQYDPMPVGQTPTATLPATKKLGNFNAGQVLTIAAIEKDIASGSFSWVSKKTWPLGGTSPTPTVVPTIAPAVTPQPTIAAPPTPSPRPSISVSPKATSPPRSLISPRQSVAPEETPPPNTRPSPSAKFAPRDGPKMSPRKSPSQSDESSGPRQGKQKPGNAPSATPDDDDE
jgi:hypothetical protein